MFQGALFAVTACFVWGLIFVVPQFMEGFTPIEIAMGRYFSYGILSILVLLKSRFKLPVRYPIEVWMKALFYSLLCTFIYYIALILALRYSSPAVAALVLGISPITIAFYGNWKTNECSYKKLILPSLFITIGLLIINVPHLVANDFSADYLFGLFCSFISLGAWTWYVVSNSDFLKNNQEISPTEWSTIMGVTTLFWVVVCGFVLLLFFENQLNIQRYIEVDALMINFFIGSLILGFLSSWVGSYLWNRASVNLPVPLAGQLTIFETIFGLLFVYTVAGNFPPLFECLGIAILLGAVFYGLRQSSQTASEHA